MGAVLQIVESEESPDLFAEFWLIYPRRVARLNARKAWLRLSRRDRMDALDALVKWRGVWLARGEMEFVPHAASWLNGERWTDELPEQANTGPAHSSHVAAPMPMLGERLEMPEKVRALLAKLKGVRNV